MIQSWSAFLLVFHGSFSCCFMFLLEDGNFFVKKIMLEDQCMFRQVFFLNMQTPASWWFMLLVAMPRRCR